MPLISKPNLPHYPLIVVGAGFFGCTIARLFAEQFNRPVLIVEKRGHVGGNSWSEIDPETGIEFHKYGSHLFHTSNEIVWRFVNRFDEFNQYRHSVVAIHNEKFFPIPINLLTLSQFFGKPFTPEEARDFFDSFRSQYELEKVTTFEDAAVKSIGKELYEAFFKGYTQKQWQVSPNELPKETFGRIPIRLNFNNRYFSDKYEGLPVSGYGQLFNRIVDHESIHVALNTDFFDIKSEIPRDSLLVYTGPIDRFFEYKFGILGWRTLDFEIERVEVDDYQGTSVVNYPDLNVPFTRIHEFKHLHPERSYPKGKTIIMKEFSRQALPQDEPYYPINSIDDRRLILKYRSLIDSQPRVVFGGRLGTYQYLDMHMAIASAFSVFSSQVKPRFL